MFLSPWHARPHLATGFLCLFRFCRIMPLHIYFSSYNKRSTWLKIWFWTLLFHIEPIFYNFQKQIKLLWFNRAIIVFILKYVFHLLVQLQCIFKKPLRDMLIDDFKSLFSCRRVFTELKITWDTSALIFLSVEYYSSCFTSPTQ